MMPRPNPPSFRFLDDICVEIRLTTKSFANEISWKLGSCSNKYAYGNNLVFVQQCCLPPGTYNLECKDTYSDGWHGGYIEVDGTRYCESFSSGGIMTAEITIQGT